MHMLEGNHLFCLIPETLDTYAIYQTYTENRRVLNMIQDWCDECRAAAWASLDPDNSRQW